MGGGGVEGILPGFRGLRVGAHVFGYDNRGHEHPERVLRASTKLII